MRNAPAHRDNERGCVMADIILFILIYLWIGTAFVYLDRKSISRNNGDGAVFLFWFWPVVVFMMLLFSPLMIPHFVSECFKEKRP